MAKNSIRDFSATAGSNTDIQSINIDEGCAASNLNNAVRELMADLKDVSTGTIALESPQADSLTVSGDLTVDTSTLYVDSTNNRVGVGTVSPSQEIHGYSSGSDFSLKLESASATGTAYTYYKNADQEYAIGIRGSASDSFQIIDMTADAVRLFMDTSGNVGIGVTDPSSYYATGLVVDGTNSNGITVSSGTSDVVGVYFADGTSGDDRFRGYVQYEHANNSLLLGSNASEAARIDSSGRLLVGATSYPTYGIINATSTTSRDGIQVHANSTSAVSQLAFRNPNGYVGTIQSSGSSTSYNTSSDYRLKENVTEVTGAADRVKALNPVRFNFISDPDTTVDGFLAHEVQEIVPEAVTGAKDAMRDEEYEVTPAVEATYDDEGNVLTEAVPAVMGIRSVPDYQGIDQSKLVPLLTAALQEALTKIDDLESRLSALETA